jgi:dTDP-glucose 4,6-dehydratase/UDP-glucuronate decarboxylase
MSKFSRIEIEDAEGTFNSLCDKGIFPTRTRWLITGAGGFLGSQILNVLQEAKKQSFDCEIVVMDSNIRGSVRDWYFDEAQVVKHDVVQPWPNLGDFTHILHLASIASPVYYRQFPMETLQSNYLGTINALDQAQKNGSKLLLMSSSEIYGDPTPENIPTPETYRGNVSSIGPRACYDEGKRVMETLAWIYQNQSEMNISIARPFNFYGPGMRLDDGRILPDFFNSIVSQSDIVLYSDGKPTRSFCYVSDAIGALFQMVFDEKSWKLYNVGNSNTEISMSELATITGEIAHSLGWKGNIRFEASKDSDFLANNPNRRLPKTNLIKNELSWVAKVDLKTGLTRSIEHFMEISR